MVATPTTGLNHIDVAAARSRGIRVLSLQGEKEFLKDVRATAEHTLALTLSLLRQIPDAVHHVRNQGWERDSFRGCEIYEKTVAVLGYGRLGRIVARYFSALGARVLAFDPAVQAEEIEPPARFSPLEDALSRADLVTLHINLSDANAALIDRRLLEKMKPGSWFINTSRGELVDEKALLEALESGHLRGAALDVISNECEWHQSGLIQYARSHSNLIVTPHLGGCTRESMEKTEVFLARRVLEALRTE